MIECYCRVAVLKMGNISLRVVIGTTSLAFQTSVPTITQPMLLDVTSLFMPTCLDPPCLRGQCRLLHSLPWNCKSFKWSFNAYNKIHTGNVCTYTGFNKYSAWFVQDRNQCHGGDENGKYCA